MPTLQEVKNQMDKVRTQLEIFDRFDEEIKKTENDLRKLSYKLLKILRQSILKRNILLI